MTPLNPRKKKDSLLTYCCGHDDLQPSRRASSERIGNKEEENKRKLSLYLLFIGTTI
jgi:hypothetical protein